MAKKMVGGVEILDEPKMVSIVADKSLFVSGDAQPEEPKKKRGRPPKKKEQDVTSSFEETPINSNMPYTQTYAPIYMQLAQTVNQIDDLSYQINEDIAKVRKFKDSVRHKYEYITALTGSTCGLIGNRISALREMGSITSKCHDLELRRAKELNATVQQIDDDKAIMDMYKAYIGNANMAGMGNPVAGMPYAPVMMNQAQLMSAGIGVNNDYDPGYDEYMRNLTPEQNMMLLEDNPNVQQVVIYDADTQQKAFAVIDRMTGEPIPNTPTLPDEILNNVVVDVVKGTARAASFNMNFPLKIIGNRAINEY